MRTVKLWWTILISFCHVCSMARCQAKQSSSRTLNGFHGEEDDLPRLFYLISISFETDVPPEVGGERPTHLELFGVYQSTPNQAREEVAGSMWYVQCYSLHRPGHSDMFYFQRQKLHSSHDCGSQRLLPNATPTKCLLRSGGPLPFRYHFGICALENVTQHDWEVFLAVSLGVPMASMAPARRAFPGA